MQASMLWIGTLDGISFIGTKNEDLGKGGFRMVLASPIMLDEFPCMYIALRAATRQRGVRASFPRHA